MVFCKAPYFAVVLVLLQFACHVSAQDASPCPRLFVYEPRRPDEPDKWYGIITLLSESELTGVWLRVLFDAPTLQIGNWFGEAVTRDENNMDYLIKNREFRLAANTPKTIRIFVKYDTNAPVPKLKGFRLNAKTICPEGGDGPPSTTMAPVLQTSGTGKPGVGTTSFNRPQHTPAPPTQAPQPSNHRPPFSWATRPSIASAATDDDEAYPGDFNSGLNLFKPRPAGEQRLEDVCGTVVTPARRRRKRQAGSTEVHYYYFSPDRGWQVMQQSGSLPELINGWIQSASSTTMRVQTVHVDPAPQQHVTKGHATVPNRNQDTRITHSWQRPTTQRPTVQHFDNNRVTFSNHGFQFVQTAPTSPSHGNRFKENITMMHNDLSLNPGKPPSPSTPSPTTSRSTTTTLRTARTTTASLAATALPPSRFVADIASGTLYVSEVKKGGGASKKPPSSWQQKEKPQPQPQPPPIQNQPAPQQVGEEIVQPRPLITYGQESQEAEFPWHAALYYTKGVDLAYICGASLISKFHILTVAHCVSKRASNKPLNPDNLLVYLGKHYLKRWTARGIQDKQISNVYIHPEYDVSTYKNDIAVGKFSDPAQITDYVRPICLWMESNELGSVLHKTGTVVGWGFDQTGHVTETLMKTGMPVVSQETCIFSYPDFFSRFTNSHTYCAGFRNGTSVCNGDSGGGMVFPAPGSNPQNPRWQLRGLVSISVAVQNQFKCDASHFVVFSDVAKYLEWIGEAMKH